MSDYWHNAGYRQGKIDTEKKLESKIKELEDRVVYAENAMARAYSWPNDGDPRTEHVKASFKAYREKYPYAFTR